MKVIVISPKRIKLHLKPGINSKSYLNFAITRLPLLTLRERIKDTLKLSLTLSNKALARFITTESVNLFNARTYKVVFCETEITIFCVCNKGYRFVFYLLISVKRNHEIQSYTLDIQFKGNRSGVITWCFVFSKIIIL